MGLEARFGVIVLGLFSVFDLWLYIVFIQLNALFKYVRCFVKCLLFQFFYIILILKMSYSRKTPILKLRYFYLFSQFKSANISINYKQ